MSGLARLAIRGLRWDYARTGVVVLAQLLYTAIMARMLEPAAFGTFALALVVLNLARYVAQHGLSLALIQRRQLDAVEIRAAFTASLALGLAFAALVHVSAPLVARVFGDPQLAAVLSVLAWSVVLLAASTTAEALLHRRLAFRAIAVAETTGYLVGYLVIGVAVAIAGWGVWSLVASVLTQSLVHLVLFNVFARHALRPTLRWRAFRSLWSFGSVASVTGFVEFLAQQLDTLMIGRALSPALLGIYDRASLLIRIPVHHLAFGLVRVLFPSLARMQDDLDASRRTYYGAVALAAAALLPLGVGAAIAAPVVVDVVLGPTWAEAAPVFAILAIAAPLHMLSMITATAWGALDRMRPRLLVQSVYLIALIGALAVAMPYGIAVVAFALVVCETLRFVAFAIATARWLRPDRTTAIRAYAAPVVAAVLTAAAVAGADALAAHGGWPSAARLAFDMAAGAAALVIAVIVGPLRFARPHLRRMAAGR